MNGTIVIDGVPAPATKALIDQAAAGDGFYWLDLLTTGSGSDPEVRDLLTTTCGFHPVAVDAADQFGQRARIDDYGDFVHTVTFGMAADATQVEEVHCFITSRSIISLHPGACPAIESVRERIASHHATGAVAPQVAIFYLLMDSLIDSFFPVLSDFDDEIDDLETAILKAPTEDQLGTLFAMKRRLLAIRKVINPQRDMLSSLNAGMVTIPGMTDAAGAYYRSLFDHLIRISDMVDGYRDLVGGAMDTHLSMVSNRLNVVMKQLAIIATIFMPLGFLTGFFGQNFLWETNTIEPTFRDFLLIGIAPELVAIALLVVLFRRRGWLGGPTA